MFILKIMGSLMIIIASTLIGNIFGSKYSLRLKNIKGLINCIRLLESEILYLSNPLPEAFDNVYKKGSKNVSYIFRDIRKYLIENDDKNVLESFKYIINKNKVKLSLTKDDIEILVSLASILGTSDKQDQQKHIKVIIEQLKIQQRDAFERMKKNEALYKKLGLLLGLALVIILF
ncbi:MAG: stage III sporulation protein AB [Firmicutes bacterium]|nr:stage III sporulation protein AB [Bacillota bacterium]